MNRIILFFSTLFAGIFFLLTFVLKIIRAAFEAIQETISWIVLAILALLVFALLTMIIHSALLDFEALLGAMGDLIFAIIGTTVVLGILFIFGGEIILAIVCTITVFISGIIETVFEFLSETFEKGMVKCLVSIDKRTKLIGGIANGKC